MKLYWQPCLQKSTVFTAFRSNSRHTENKVNGRDGASTDDASSQPHISVQQIKLPFVFYEGAMTSWQGNPDTRVLPEKAAITESTHPNQIGCFRERSSLAGVQFVIYPKCTTSQCSYCVCAYFRHQPTLCQHYCIFIMSWCSRRWCRETESQEIIRFNWYWQQENWSGVVSEVYFITLLFKLVSILK